MRSVNSQRCSREQLSLLCHALRARKANLRYGLKGRVACPEEVLLAVGEADVRGADIGLVHFHSVAPRADETPDENHPRGSEGQVKTSLRQ